MRTVGRLLWLPVAPENFFSAMTDPPLLPPVPPPSGPCESDRRGDIPHLRESVFRRLVEVLPASFGYDRVGAYTLGAESTESPRPRSLRMTLHPRTATVGLES